MATKAFSSVRRRLAPSKVWMLLTSMALAVLLASGVAWAAAGDLDPSFGEGGKVIIEQNAEISDVAVQRADGKIVVAGSSDGRLLLMRLLPRGTIDDSFGGGDGVVTTDLAATYDESVNAVLVRPDGKIVVAGVGELPRYKETLVLVRYKPNGTIDDSFGGGDGKVFTKPDGVGTTSASALLRLPGSGKLVVAGIAGDSSLKGITDDHVLLVRYLANGRRDRIFGGGDGIVISKFGGTALDVVRQKYDGKLVVAGHNYADHSSEFMFVRRLSNGSPDKSFGNEGKKIVKVFSGYGSYAETRALIIRPDGKMVAAGGVTSYSDLDQEPFGRLALVRLKPNGALDPGFGGGDGKVTGGMEPYGAYDLLRQQDNKLVAVGTNTVRDFASDWYTVEQSFALRRYNPNGSLDASFGSGGEVLTNFPAFSSAYAGVLRSDRKVVVAGNSRYNDQVVLARYLTE